MKQDGQMAKESRPLQKMFNEVPDRYDWMNRLLTFRLDERWRKMAAKRSILENPSLVVDICTGTGDLACHLSSYHIAGRIVALDFSEPMLEVARKKHRRRELPQVDFIFADVGELPFENESVDVVTVGFGFRNLTYKNPKKDIYLKEIFRVLKKEGKFIIIETSQPKLYFIKILYHLYLILFVKYIGSFLSGNKRAYTYLSRSATQYYGAKELEQLLYKMGFKQVTYRLFCFGIAALHEAVK